MQVLCNKDDTLITFANENQHKRLVALVNKAYDIFRDRVKPEIMQKYQKKKNAPLIPPHEHKLEICKIYNCNFLKNSIKNLL